MKERFERKKGSHLGGERSAFVIFIARIGGLGGGSVGGAAPRRRTVCQLTHVCNVKTESRGVRRSEEEEMGERERGEDVGDSKGGRLELWWGAGTLEDTVRSRCLYLIIGGENTKSTV